MLARRFHFEIVDAFTDDTSFIDLESNLEVGLHGIKKKIGAHSKQLQTQIFCRIKTLEFARSDDLLIVNYLVI